MPHPIDSETREQRMERYRKYWRDNPSTPDDLTPDEREWCEDRDIGRDDLNT